VRFSEHAVVCCSSAHQPVQKVRTRVPQRVHAPADGTKSRFTLFEGVDTHDMAHITHGNCHENTGFNT